MVNNTANTKCLHVLITDQLTVEPLARGQQKQQRAYFISKSLAQLIIYTHAQNDHMKNYTYWYGWVLFNTSWPSWPMDCFFSNLTMLSAAEYFQRFNNCLQVTYSETCEEYVSRRRCRPISFNKYLSFTIPTLSQYLLKCTWPYCTKSINHILFHKYTQLKHSKSATQYFG